MKLDTLCAGIGLPQEVFLRVNGFLSNCDRQKLDPYIQAMTDRETAQQAYRDLHDLLGEADMAMLACQLEAAVRTHSRYRGMGISDEIYISTMKCFPRFLEETRRMTGQYRYDRAWWSYRQTSMALFRIGQLEYEICRDRKVISLHIPSDACFAPDAVEESVASAKAFLAKYYSGCAGYPIVCHSWLISPELEKLLPERSNIRSFQRRFQILSVQPEEKDFFQWLFETSEDTPLEKLPEDTSLRRKAKTLLLGGGNIGAARGVMK